jgi:hypothetical protein
MLTLTKKQSLLGHKAFARALRREQKFFVSRIFYKPDEWELVKTCYEKEGCTVEEGQDPCYGQGWVVSKSVNLSQ